MIVFDVATKVLDTENFPQHTIADLNSGITLILLFSQEKLLRWNEINTHAHTHVRARKHTQSLTKLQNYSLCESLMKSFEATKPGKTTTTK